MRAKNPFSRNRVPEDSFELFRWIFFEPFLLKNFDEEISTKETIIWFFRTSIWILLFSIFFYLIINILLSYFEIPYYINIYFSDEVMYQLSNMSDFSNKLLFLLNYSYKKFIIWSIFGSLIGGVIWAIIGNLLWSLIISLSIGIILGITKAFISDIIIATTLWTFVLGLIMGFAIDIKTALFIGVLGFIASFATEGFNAGVGVFLSFEIGFIISFFGFLFFPFHQIKTFFNVSLIDNPYLDDAKIYLPIFTLDKKLKEESFKKPFIANKFKFFLLKYRPLQKELAEEISYIINASYLYYNPLDSNNIKISDRDSDDEKLIEWVSSLREIKNNLIRFKNQGNINNQILLLHKLISNYHNLLEDTQKLSYEWRDYYIRAINENIKSANELLTNLKAKKEHIF